MKANIGTTDKAMRISVGLILMMVGILASMGTTLTVIFMAAGIFNLMTSVFGFCLLYRLIGINTCKMENRR